MIFKSEKSRFLIKRVSACADNKMANFPNPVPRARLEHQSFKGVFTMSKTTKPSLMFADANASAPREGPSTEEATEEEGLDLPVDPDEGTNLIPDDERVVNVPS